MFHCAILLNLTLFLLNQGAMESTIEDTYIDLIFNFNLKCKKQIQYLMAHLASQNWATVLSSFYSLSYLCHEIE